MLNKNIRKFKPSFEPVIGFHYKEIEEYLSLEEQIQFLESLEKIGILSSKPTESMFTCNFCKFHSFALKLMCTLCRSSNVVFGTIIQHDVCGHVDLDYKYIGSDGKLVCGKCNKSLKALGVDHSKQGDFFKCAECKAVLPNIEKLYMCLKCGESSTENELDLMKLRTFTVNPEILAAHLNKNNGNPFISIVDELSNVGLKSAFSDSVVGISQIRHTFDIVVYDSKNMPILTMDIIESSQQHEMKNATETVSTPRSENDKQEELVLSFIAKCIDTNIPNKVILAIPPLKKNLKPLINHNGIKLIESLTHDEAIIEAAHTIAQICDTPVDVKYTYDK
jgi:hypothetical protein